MAAGFGTGSFIISLCQSAPFTRHPGKQAPGRFLMATGGGRSGRKNSSTSSAEPRRDDNEGRPVTSGQIPEAARRWLQRSALQSQSRKRISDLPLSSSAVEMAQARASCPSPLCVFAPLRLCVETAAIKTQRRKDAKSQSINPRRIPRRTPS